MRRNTCSVRYEVAVAGFTIAGTPGEQRRRQLLQHSPYREIEGVDVNGRALERQTNVLADEAPALREHLDGAIDINTAVGKLARTLAGVHEERADAAVDVDPGVALRRARGVGERDRTRPCIPSSILATDLSSPARSWNVSSRKLGPPTLRASPEHGAIVEPFSGGAGDHLIRRCIAQRRRSCRARPAISRLHNSAIA